MTLKKFALRGMIVLAAVIALCVLFSGTFRTLTTPKVSLEHAKNGKMESSTVLMGKVVFPEEEEMNIQVPEELRKPAVEREKAELFDVIDTLYPVPKWF